jgi:hypothetical protein
MAASSRLPSVGGFPVEGGAGAEDGTSPASAPGDGGMPDLSLDSEVGIGGGVGDSGAR